MGHAFSITQTNELTTVISFEDDIQLWHSDMEGVSLRAGNLSREYFGYGEKTKFVQKLVLDIFGDTTGEICCVVPEVQGQHSDVLRPSSSQLPGSRSQ